MTSLVRPGLNIVGFLNSESGVGEAARLAREVVRAAGVPHASFVPHGDPSPKRRISEEPPPPGAPYKTNLICVNSNLMLEVAARLPSGLLTGNYNICYWAWELSRLPPHMLDGFRDVDEVWTYSEFAAAAFRQAMKVPVYVWPLPILRPSLRLASERPPKFATDRMTFLCSFDFLSVMERKNPAGVVTAFKRAFQDNEGPLLIVKGTNGGSDVRGRTHLLDAIGGRTDIHFLGQVLSRSEQDALIAKSDVYVSLHRSEGFGLQLGEAMALGTPVLATAYSGNLEFMQDTNSYLVPSVSSKVPPGCWPYPEGYAWVEPDLDAAADLMRYIVEHPDEAQERAATAQHHIATHHSVDARVPFLIERLSSVENVHLPVRRAVRASRDAVLRRSTDAMMSRLRLSVEQQGPLRSVAGNLRRLAQRALLPRDLGARLAWLESQMTSLPFTGDDRPLAVAVDGREAIGFDRRYLIKSVFGDAGYAHFEEIFRGPSDRVREVLECYRPYLREGMNVVDIGCGRGDFLDLCAEWRVNCVGVDVDADMVAYAAARGHAVVQRDARDYLDMLDAETLDCVFSSQVVEHIPIDRLVGLLRAAKRALRPGGIFIAETVNPHCPAALRLFWIDPTHQNPLFPEALCALLWEAGYQNGHVVFPRGSGTLAEDRLSEPQYAVVARA